jgi:hypothetical protein
LGIARRRAEAKEAIRPAEEIRDEEREGGREMKLSTVEKATGVAAGVILSMASMYAILRAAMWVIFESGRVMTLAGWYGLLIPAGLLAAPMLALKWALSKRKKGAK